MEGFQGLWLIFGVPWTEQDRALYSPQRSWDSRRTERNYVLLSLDAHTPSTSCLQLSPDPLAPVRGNLHSWVERLIFPPACLFLLNNVTEKGGHGKQRCWVFLDELSIQESLSYWGKRHGLSLSAHGHGGLLLLGIFLPSHFAKISVQRLLCLTHSQQQTRSYGFLLQRFTGWRIR